MQEFSEFVNDGKPTVFVSNTNQDLGTVAYQRYSGGGGEGILTVRCSDGSINTSTSGGVCTISVSPAFMKQADADNKYVLNTTAVTTYATKTELAGKQDKLTAGANITIVDNVISSTGGGGGGTSYTAGEGIAISGSTISADFTKVASAASVSGKQDKLTAGANITIVGNVISSTGGGGTRTYEKFVVVGVYGQSNAVGYDESALTKYDVPFDPARIMQYSDSLKPLTFCAENIQNMNTVQARNAAEQGNMRDVRSGSDPDLITSAVDRLTYTATKGIHLPLANLICSVIPEDYGVIIVPGAIGDQNIDAFVRGQNNYTQFLNRIKAALALNEDNILAGIVWCQGEFNVGQVASTYIQKFEGIVNNLHDDIKAAHPRQMFDAYTPKNYWFVFEWPEYWKRNDSTHLLDAYKTAMGDGHYVDIPSGTPANVTTYTSATAAAHYGQDAYRKVIAPRVFAKMHAAGVFNTVATASGGVDSSIVTRVESLEAEVAGLTGTVQQLNALVEALTTRVDTLSGYHDLPPVEKTWKTVTESMITQVYGSGSVLGDGELSMGQNQTVLLPADVTRIRATPGDQIGQFRLLGMVLGAVPDAEPAAANSLIAAFTYFNGNAVMRAHLNDGSTIKLSATSGSDVYTPTDSGWGSSVNPIVSLLGQNTSTDAFELEKLDKAKLRVTNRTSGASIEMDMSTWPFFQNGGEIRFGFCGYNANNSGMKLTGLEYYA